ncbi:acyclic terpene utilization AtuA family protein [Flexibacterium corallicola]|uniref:acyclic terpene utilization AtuA family protein n=1 Tax=Flexibacterium corallicola TaxID=3037259 RepID=UPI00286F17F2|nr:acyclic terpene utilization AtuA family protein [Pseudovibrio sp. M1P-2-3]
MVTQSSPHTSEENGHPAKTLRIGGASGFWGDWQGATQQLLANDRLEFIVYDYLAEVTMSIMARAREKDPKLGYAVDFVDTVLAQNLKKIAESNTKILSNAGGMNPLSCGEKIQRLVDRAGLDLKIAVVTGDDLTANAQEFSEAGTLEMFSKAEFPNPKNVVGINAYLGAEPVVAALEAGADIVITGRCADSALTLAACIYSFGWGAQDYDLLAAGSLAGHLLECGLQATGGNFTDWESVPDAVNMGYPIADIKPDGTMFLTKAANTGGLVSFGTVAEQLIYEIGDPAAYLLPDVTCDFTCVQIEQAGENRVHIKGAKGKPAPKDLKVSLVSADGWRLGVLLAFAGLDAAKKADHFASCVLERANNVLKKLGAPPYIEISKEIIGAGSQLGTKNVSASEEVVLKLAVHHADQRATQLLLREVSGFALGGPPGLLPFNGGRARPTPVIGLFSFLIDRKDVSPTVTMDGETVPFTPQVSDLEPCEKNESPQVDILPEIVVREPYISVPLVELAYARSGDKGNKVNIGIIARKPEYLPWIAKGLSTEGILEAFAHFRPESAEVFHLSGVHALNIVLNDVLAGGGISSLRMDPQGKAYAQVLLHQSIVVPEKLVSLKTISQSPFEIEELT